MSEELSCKSHTMAWVIAITAVAPLLYALSVPWAFVFLVYSGHFNGATVYLAYAAPYRWAATGTALEKPLTQYFEWCMKTAGVRPPIQ